MEKKLNNYFIEPKTPGISCKWPEMRVSGEKVTKEQAMEIIAKTGALDFFSNDKEWERICYDIFEIPYTSDGGFIQYDYEKKYEILESYGCLEIHYIRNSNIGSAYVGGPIGWVDWDGTIFSSGHNIGKWPSLAEVVEEWSIVADAFPYLDLKVQLFSGEQCEEGTVPLQEIRVKDGKVHCYKFIEDEIPAAPEDDGSGFAARLLSEDGERGCSIETLHEIKKLLDSKKQEVKNSRN